MCITELIEGTLVCEINNQQIILEKENLKLLMSSEYTSIKNSLSCVDYSFSWETVPLSRISFF